MGGAQGGGGVSFPGKKRYEGVQFNVISIRGRSQLSTLDVSILTRATHGLLSRGPVS